MGFFNKCSRAAPPTATDFVADEKASPPPVFDKKSAHSNEFESTTPTQERHVVPQIENRVV